MSSELPDVAIEMQAAALIAASTLLVNRNVTAALIGYKAGLKSAGSHVMSPAEECAHWAKDIIKAYYQEPKKPVVAPVPSDESTPTT
jgi:hypothetical protein